MIFYFSGTGNSLYIAKKIAEHNKEDLISIAAVMNSKAECFEYTLKENEVIGFVYPVYAWAPPRMVLKFIEGLKFNNYKNNYIFTVATCGKNIGNTIKVLDDSLKKKNLQLKSGFSVQMPNNYIVTGDVDSKEIEKKKLVEAEETLKNINKFIEGRREDIYQVVKGRLPGLLTFVINPLFNKKGIDSRKFYTNGNCTGCGLCENICNCQTIKIKGKPVWGQNCSQCFACLNLCPTKAIQYGKGTENKGRYKNPDISVNEMKII